MGSRVVLLLGPPLSEVIAVVLSGKEEVFQLTLGLKTSRLLSALSFYLRLPPPHHERIR